MSSSNVPAEAPPPYSKHDPTPHKTRNGIPPEHRRSMEDLNRPLPDGWVRQYDSQNQHQFYVDTRADPPRAIWQHPYDDDTFLSTLSSEERERIESLHRVPTPADVLAESSDEEDHHPHTAPKRQDSNPNSVQRWGRKVKDKVTHSTHQQRETERQKRADEEQRAYEAHMAFRRAMQRSIETGKPQYIGKDRQGKEVYIAPPQGVQGMQFGPNGRVINPYSQGPYANSYASARYIQPSMPYQRPYGYGYGGGFGLPLAGGLAGGMLLGGMVGGFGL